MDISTSSCQTGVEAGNRPVPESDLQVRSPEPSADEPEVRSTPEAHQTAAPIVARIPDVEADDLWEEQSAGRPRDGRLLSQKLSLKLLAAGGLLLAVAAVTPFFWSRGSSDPKGTGDLPDWHPGPPAPTAEMAPSWKPSTVQSAQAGAQSPAPGVDIGFPANAPSSGASPAGSSGWPAEPAGAEGLAGFAPPPGHTSDGQTPAAPPDDPRLHVLAPPGARYGSPFDAGDHMQGQPSAQAPTGGQSCPSHPASQCAPRGEWAGSPAPASNSGAQSYPQDWAPAERSRGGGGTAERYPQREIPQYPAASGPTTGHPSAGNLQPSYGGRPYDHGTATQPRSGAEQSAAGRYPATNTQPAFSASQAGLPSGGRYWPVENSPAPTGVDPPDRSYSTSQGWSSGNVDSASPMSARSPASGGYLPHAQQTPSSAGARANYPGGTGVPYGSGGPPSIPERGQRPGTMPSPRPESQPYGPAAGEPDASGLPAGQSGAYAPNSHVPTGAAPSGAAVSSGVPAAVADRRGSIAPYEPYRRDYRDSSMGYSAGYRDEYSGTYSASGRYPRDYQDMPPGSGNGAGGAARLEGIIERPDMGTRY